METQQQREKAGRPKARQSLAHVPSNSNTTTDIAALRRAEETKSRAKRSRGKSLGPGGLEALTETSAHVFKAIPSFEELRNKNTGKQDSLIAKNGVEDLLIDFSTPGANRNSGSGQPMAGMENVVDPFSPVAPSNARSAEEQQALEDEERRRQEQKQAILEQRAARRKSLANRRVSFAPEATLHTWSVMELMEDSTTSSASNSTRRQSAMTAAQSPAKETERPSTPVEQQNEKVIQHHLESQRDLHQRKRRRTSEHTQSSDDDAFSSPGDGADSSPIRVEDSIDSESDTDGDTAMSLDELTQNTDRSSASSSSQTSLDERLRHAASLAGTRGISYDENGSDLDQHEDDGDQTMDLADGTVTHAFRPYARQGHAASNPHDSEADKENANHWEHKEPAYPSPNDREDSEATAGMTMDITRAVGGILSKNSGSEPRQSTRRQSNVSRRDSSGAESSYGDETMDMTVAKGGILSEQVQSAVNEQFSDDEMTMEMTKAIGGIRKHTRRDSTPSMLTEETASMDMTVAVGGILPPIEEQTEPQSFVEGDKTGAMDMTRAVGGILPNTAALADNNEDMTEDLAGVQSPSAQLNQELGQMLSTASTTAGQMATVASETGSPTLKPRLSARRATSSSRISTPRSDQKLLSPIRVGQTTPSKQLTPAPLKSVSPKRTPLLTSNVSTRSASPKKLFAKEIQHRASPAARRSPWRPGDALFSHDENTGLHTPRVVLHAPKPHQHLRPRSSEVGINNDATGSPRVSELLSGRKSIGELVPEFHLRQGQVRQIQFEDPQLLEQEVDAERAEEHRRESGRFIMEQEASAPQDENNTQSLKEMIESMSPKKEKKPKIRARKSLAVGSAKGLLGKRPAELDMEDEDDDHSPKRLKPGPREGSPVKKVHLPKPPTKDETTGRLSKAELLGLGRGMPSTTTPTLLQSAPINVKSPEQTRRFRSPASAEKPTSFAERMDNVVGAINIATTHPEAVKPPIEEKVSLQDFLNMTNVHFIELSTTKRRHTMAHPNTEAANDRADATSAACFVAAATTLPLLELYQHATRELKSYISSGRKIIRQIEAETWEDQPAIFKEYVDARPEVKAVMDNRFRNGKTNARLQSKEGWYTWRGQLVDGLQSGLEGIRVDMQKDKKVLVEQIEALDRVVPPLNSRKQQLDSQLHELRRRLNELDSINQDDLRERRQELLAIDEEVLQRAKEAQKLEQDMREKQAVLTSATELRQEIDDQINEAVRVQEEQRRWPAKDVAAHRAKVEKLEQEYGWKLLNAEEEDEGSNGHGVGLTLRYQHQLRLFFYPSAFQLKRDEGRRRSGRASRSVSGPNAPISLTYSPDDEHDALPRELPTELRFFLQLIQGQLQAYTMMPKGTITCQTVVKTVSEGWTLAQKIAQEIRELSAAGIVRTSILSDDKLGVKLMLMQSDRSRIDVDFTLTVLAHNDGYVTATTNVSAVPIYGSATSIVDASKTRKVQSALSKEVESKILGESCWISAVRGFEGWLQAQRQPKAPEPTPEPEQLRAKPTTRSLPKAQSQAHDDSSPKVKSPAKRAVTTSPTQPQSTTSPKQLSRSPLAPKNTNARIQKKSLPVPKKAVHVSTSQQESLIPQPTSFRDVQPQSQTHVSQVKGKENLVPTVAKVVETVMGTGNTGYHIKDVDENMSYDEVFGLKNGVKPAIPPEAQEAMMHTPVKRRAGALRRSPV